MNIDVKEPSFLVSWGRAFKGAGKIVVFTIIWAIIGGVLIFVGIGFMGASFPFTTPLYGDSQTIPTIVWGGTAILGLILVIIGAIIIALGFLASFLKVLTEMIREY